MNGLELLEKFLAEEISDEEYGTGIEKLTPEQKTELDAHLAKPEVAGKVSKKAQEALDKVAALRKEGKRLNDKSDDGGGSDYASTMRKENVEKAFTKLFTAYSIPAEQQQLYRDLFKTNDKGHVDSDLIFNNLKGIYASQNSDSLLEAQERIKQMEHGADDFNEAGAGNAGGSGDGGGGDKKKYSQEVLDWVKESKRRGVDITLEQAEKVLTQGMTRKIGK